MNETMHSVQYMNTSIGTITETTYMALYDNAIHATTELNREYNRLEKTLFVSDRHVYDNARQEHRDSLRKVTSPPTIHRTIIYNYYTYTHCL